jgi:hypothetical protein
MMAKGDVKAEVKAALKELSPAELSNLLSEMKSERSTELKSRAVELWRELESLNGEYESITGHALPLPAFRAAKVRAATPAAARGGKRSSRWSAESFTKAVLACLAKSDQSEARTSDIREYVEELGGSGNSLSQQHLPRLVEEGLVEQPGRGRYVMTAKGRKTLDALPV